MQAESNTICNLLGGTTNQIYGIESLIDMPKREQCGSPMSMIKVGLAHAHPNKIK